MEKMMNKNPYGDTGESDMDAPGMDNDLSIKKPVQSEHKTPKTAESLRLLGAGSPYKQDKIN